MARRFCRGLSELLAMSDEHRTTSFELETRARGTSANFAETSTEKP
jgi:hypothetical protein